MNFKYKCHILREMSTKIRVLWSKEEFGLPEDLVKNLRRTSGHTLIQLLDQPSARSVMALKE